MFGTSAVSTKKMIFCLLFDASLSRSSISCFFFLLRPAKAVRLTWVIQSRRQQPFLPKGPFHLKISTSSNTPALSCRNLPASNRVAGQLADKRGTTRGAPLSGLGHRHKHDHSRNYDGRIGRECWHFKVVQGAVLELGSAATFVPSMEIVGTQPST